MRRLVGLDVGRRWMGRNGISFLGGVWNGFGMATYTTICLRPRRGLRMNLRVRSVTGCSDAMISTLLGRDG